MPTFSEFTFLSCNEKTNIRVRRCDPDTDPIGIVQIAHGIAEHVERYDDFANFLASNGYIVVANDHLGHGKSITCEDDLGFFAENGGWELAVGDMHKLHETMREEYPKLPYIFFGHSMGSFLTRTYMIRYRANYDAVILSGTGQQPKALVAAGLAMGKLESKRKGARYKSEMLNKLAFGTYNDGFTAPRTISDWLSRDEAEVDKYIADPLCGYIPSAGLFTDMMTGIAFISNPRNVSRMKKDLPVYFMSGDKDPVGENGKGVLRAYRSFLKAGMTDVTMKLYHDGRHEMLNELNKSEVYDDILDWITNNIK
ncbi:MAG: alpha/beta hydrolase [Oscillospiraceae bacterium]|nr:alpha/beta hydrolase [Oscillospiraceae bacterium]